MSRDRYGDDVLADPRAHRRTIPVVEARPGLLVEVAADGFVGAVVGCDERRVSLRDRRGRARTFALHPAAFIVDDVRVTLRPVAGAAPQVVPSEPRLTASGSLAVPDRPAQVARASRILVEGVHDAELLELVWGEDLRIEGVVVDVLHGADDLSAVVSAFGPAQGRRLGILLDHLVAGTKESRIAAQVDHPHVLITGHPFVDIWAAVRPEVVGFDAWPEVPRGEPWKEGVARRLGVSDPQELWRRIRGSVRSWRDLDRSLIASVERLIDFVTDPEQAHPS
jgi:hypothetical protein